MACRHQDIRLFDGLRCCLACGEAVFDTNEAETLPKDQDVSNVPYQYSGLNYRLGQEIRICVLLPGDPSDDLRCELIHVNLNDDPVYDAVSYTWATQNGDTQLSCSINCIGRGFIRITANCNAVLRRLRTNGTRKQLWLDAICIDQTQVAERNHQVAMMDQVYSGARCVHICMFDTVPSSYDGYEQLFRWLRKDPMTLTPERHVLCRLLDLRYFSRVWVIQEVALARIAYLYINKHEICLDTRTISELDIALRNRRLNMPAAFRSQLHPRKDSNVISSLRAGFDSKSMDPRDKVFAVRSLMSDAAKNLISIDYSLDIARVYSNSVTTVMICEGNLNVLKYASRRAAVKDQALHDPHVLSIDGFKRYLEDESRSRPSTASAFTTLTIGNLWKAKVDICMVDDLDAQASLHILEQSEQCPPVLLCENEPTLQDLLPRIRVRAHYLDCLHSIAGSWIYDASESWSNRISSLLTRLSRRFAGRLDETSLEYITPYFRKDPANVSSSNRSYRFLTTKVSENDYPEIDFEDLTQFIHNLQSAHERDLYLFTTENSIGFAAGSFEASDEVWAVDGVDTLLLLRKMVNGTYRVVCECYLWAAWELDYWNPGTKKGRWREDSIKPAWHEKTKIIEIY